jgi:hypothetical protein
MEDKEGKEGIEEVCGYDLEAHVRSVVGNHLA